MCPICLSGLVIALGSAGAVGGVGVAVAKRRSARSQRRGRPSDAAPRTPSISIAPPPAAVHTALPP
jgi:hypothetical protein